MKRDRLMRRDAPAVPRALLRVTFPLERRQRPRAPCIAALSGSSAATHRAMCNYDLDTVKQNAHRTREQAPTPAMEVLSAAVARKVVRN
jgi:hypothetical protein